MKKRLIALIALTFMGLTARAHDIEIRNPDGTSVHFDVEVARTFDQRRRGLKSRKHLPDHKGMLFLYENPTNVGMWMKNTPVSLDMIFFNEDNTVHHIQEQTRPYSTALIGPVANTMTVLEIPAGSCQKHGIQLSSHLGNRPT